MAKDKSLFFGIVAVAYLATFILGAASSAIHPACYAYVGAVLPILTAFIYLYTCTLIPRFGAATVLNGFILVLFLIVGEADLFCVIGMMALTALAEILRKAKGYETLKMKIENFRQTDIRTFR